MVFIKDGGGGFGWFLSLRNGFLGISLWRQYAIDWERFPPYVLRLLMVLSCFYAMIGGEKTPMGDLFPPFFVLTIDLDVSDG